VLIANQEEFLVAPSHRCRRVVYQPVVNVDMKTNIPSPDAISIEHESSRI
jgi:hypothetical protein